MFLALVYPFEIGLDRGSMRLCIVHAQNENQALHEKLRELREQASELKAVIDAR